MVNEEWPSTPPANWVLFSFFFGGVGVVSKQAGKVIKQAIRLSSIEIRNINTLNALPFGVSNQKSTITPHHCLFQPTTIISPHTCLLRNTHTHTRYGYFCFVIAINFFVFWFEQTQQQHCNTVAYSFFPLVIIVTTRSVILWFFPLIFTYGYLKWQTTQTNWINSVLTVSAKRKRAPNV